MIFMTLISFYLFLFINLVMVFFLMTFMFLKDLFLDFFLYMKKNLMPVKHGIKNGPWPI